MSDPLAKPERRLIYSGQKVDLALQSVRTADGSYQDREVVIHRGAVALLPMVDADHVCLIKNFRYSAGKTLIEIPAGTIDPGETADSTAPRELAEETGYRAGRIVKLKEWWVSPGVFTELMTLYLCEELEAGASDHQADEHIENLVVPWSEALLMATDGRIEDAKTILAILYYERLRQVST